MKSLNALIIKYFQLILFVYRVKNAILVKKLKNKVRNALNNAFMMHIVFAKRNVNILQKHTILNIKRLIFIWSIKKSPKMQFRK